MLKREDIPANLHEEINTRNYLLVIGIDQYQYGISNLKNAVLDAQKFKECLFEKYQFEEKYCFELYNSQATRKKVLKLFDYLQTQITDQDNIVLYFSGHGKYLSTTDKGFLLLSDAEKNNRSTYLPNDAVKDFIKTLNLRHAFLLIDSCFSGTLFRSNEDIPISRIYNSPSRYLLTSGRYDELVSDGVPGKHSPFCLALLTTLNQNEGDKIWVGDLCRKVLKKVTCAIVGQNPRGEALKELGHKGGEFAFFPKQKKDKDSHQIRNQKTRSQAPTLINFPEGKNQKQSKKTLILSNKESLELKRMIGNGEIDQVIDSLLKYNHLSTKASDEIVLLERHWKDLQRDERIGILSTDEKFRLTNKFTLSLISAVDTLKITK